MYIPFFGSLHIGPTQKHSVAPPVSWTHPVLASPSALAQRDTGFLSSEGKRQVKEYTLAPIVCMAVGKANFFRLCKGSKKWIGLELQKGLKPSAIPAFNENAFPRLNSQ